jgi:hypothetical protein
MTLEHFRSFLTAGLRHYLIATTFLYAVRPPCAARTREDEVLEWLRHKVPACTDLAGHRQSRAGLRCACRQGDHLPGAVSTGDR